MNRLLTFSLGGGQSRRVGRGGAADVFRHADEPADERFLGDGAAGGVSPWFGPGAWVTG
jgi:hypothetical protein